MLRFLGYIAFVAAVTALSVWMADRPGSVRIEWLGWRLDSSVPVLAGLLAVLFALLFLGQRLLNSVLRIPAAYGRRRLETRRRQGYQALSDGMAAVLGGDGDGARKLAGRAGKLLKDPKLTSVLAAEAAKLSGHKDSAREHFETLLDRKETAALGLKGLLEQALEDGNDEEALALANRAAAANPKDGWAAGVACGLAVKCGRLDQAGTLLDRAAKSGALDKAVVRRRRALIADAKAEQAERRGDSAEALSQARRAAKDAPFPAALRLARLQAAAGQERSAAATLERAWASAPATEFAQAYGALRPDENPLARLRRLEKLVSGNRTAAEAHLVLGRAALEAKLWGQARKHLLDATESRPTAEIFRLLERLEREEFGDIGDARKWAERASSAPSESGWQCGACGQASDNWALVCPHCGAVDGMSRPGAAA